jgi:iron complex outermembrane recepter protein
MTRRISAIAAGSFWWVIASMPNAYAQSATSGEGAASESLGEIIVTARRKAEALQDVPQTVTAVTADEIQKLNILTMQDITQVVTGLQISGGGLGAVESVRGVTSNQTSQVPALTLGHYINDVPISNTVTFYQGLYDVGQVEVLKGPQGTTRGIATPGGAITLTTRRADLEEMGGYADATVTNRNAHNIQAAIDFPIIAEKLAIRVAGLEDDNEGDGVRSVNSPFSPDSKTDSARISVRFEPTDSIAANLMYEYLYRRDVSLGSGVYGTGGPGGPDASPNYNGPAIGMYDRNTAATVPTIGKTEVNLLTGQFDWAFAGQKLSYVGSWSYFSLNTTGEDGNGNSAEANTLPNIGTGFFQHIPDHASTYELRLSSEERVAGLFDYVVGAYHSDETLGVVVNNGPTVVLPGFFGAPGNAPNPFTTNTRFAEDIFITAPSTREETSFFGNLTAHLGDKLEVSAGTRHLHLTNAASTGLSFLPGYAAAALPATACAAAGGQYGATYAGACDVPVPGAAFPSAPGSSASNEAWIYDVSVSYHVTPDFMPYVHVGSSFLPGGSVSTGITNASNDPLLNILEILRPEKSTSYEGGFKWSFLNHRARLNADYYHQVYNNFFYSSPFPTYYDTGVPGPNRVQTHAFTNNVPAKIDGFDIELGMSVTEQWSVDGNFSYAKGRLAGEIPCNSSGFNGIPDLIVPPSNGSTFVAAGKSIALCPSNASTSIAPLWNLSLQSEYDVPVTDRVDAFIRGLYTLQPRNPNASQNYVVPAYNMLNLFLGVHDPSRRWEVDVFGKNITNTVKVLTLGANPIQPYLPGNTLALFGPSGYTAVTLTPRREFGINVRYMFGSG